MLQPASHRAQPFVYGAIMEAMREAWTDERLDYLNHRVDDGFTRVDERFKWIDERFEQIDRRFDKVDAQLQRVNDRIDDLFRVMTQIGGGIGVALIGLIATQL
jgi:ribosome assembly protein YihI (activator of Der GTPase)